MVKDMEVSVVSSYEDSKLLDETAEGFEASCELKNRSNQFCLYLRSNTFKWKPLGFKVTFEDHEVRKNQLLFNPTDLVKENQQATLLVDLYFLTFLKSFEFPNHRTFSVVIDFLKNNKNECCSTFKISFPRVIILSRNKSLSSKECPQEPLCDSDKVYEEDEKDLTMEELEVGIEVTEESPQESVYDSDTFCEEDENDSTMEELFKVLGVGIGIPV